ncbi:MAG: hypothetical protein HN353_00905 [Bdellovibrionales bacterium]|jgi:hypothetical protein|nr:hypothetical protein [Bdellovibrionales bacterium]MBT3526772.1 hypothetical protein [Bdellovibrionales bacterium]MBT7767591.1 hypothetical protein [Bdellovibrionales bacterium]
MSLPLLRSKKSEPLIIKIDKSQLTNPQIRLLRSLNCLLKDILITSDETEYFDGSAEVMRLCAALIRQAQFNVDHTQSSEIPYAKQALEYSTEVLREYIETAKIITFDN